MKGKEPIRLPSSRKIFGHDNGNCEKNTLISLLEEGWKRKLKLMDKIIITNESLRDNFNCEDIPTENDLVSKRRIITYGELNKIYKRMFGEKYFPEEEQKRRDFEMAVIERQGERRAAWGNYAATMDYIRAVEEAQEEERLEQEGDEEGLAELKSKQDKRQHMLRIG